MIPDTQATYGPINATPAQDRKVKGLPLVMVGLRIGMIQAFLTMPYGGGPACFIILGGLFGGIGMIICATKNNFSPEVKRGAYIGAVIFFVALILSVYHVILMADIDSDIDDLEDPENINEDNWKQKKSAMTDDMNSFIDKISIFIFLLATTTGLLAVGATIHVFMSEHEKKRFMFIPMSLFVATLVIVPVVTVIGFGDFREVLDDLDDADSDSELREVAYDAKKLDADDAIRGSQIGGVLNLINLILVAVVIAKRERGFHSVL